MLLPHSTVIEFPTVQDKLLNKVWSVPGRISFKSGRIVSPGLRTTKCIAFWPQALVYAPGTQLVAESGHVHRPIGFTLRETVDVDSSELIAIRRRHDGNHKIIDGLEIGRSADDVVAQH